MSEIEWTAWAFGALLAVVLGVWVVWAAASRLDRLHRRVLATRVTLDAQLARRAKAAWDIAAAGVLDPVSSVLVAEAAGEALEHVNEGLAPVDAGDVAGELDQAMAESELSRVLRAALGTPEDRAQLEADSDATELLGNLDQAWYRVQLARRFHNDAVVQVRRIRAKGYVRVFRLAGRAPVPVTFEMDDATTTI